MLLKLTELHLNSPPTSSIGHGGVAEEGSNGTEPLVGDNVRIRVTGLGNLAAFGGEAQHGHAGFRPEHGEFGVGQVEFGVDRPRGIFGERGSGYDWNAAGQR